MCGSVFTQADGIVGEDVNHWNFHERCQSHGRARVVAENQKSSSKRPDFTQGHSIQSRTHGMFADAKVKIPSAVLAGFKVSRSIKCQTRFSGRSQVGCSTDEPGNILCHRIQHLGGRVASGKAFSISRKSWQIFVPAGG